MISEAERVIQDLRIHDETIGIHTSGRVMAGMEAAKSISSVKK